jgi:hypothetical protein
MYKYNVAMELADVFPYLAINILPLNIERTSDDGLISS